MRSPSPLRPIAPLAAVLLAVPAQAGPDWEEPRIDAGSHPETASLTEGVGSLRGIRGSLSDAPGLATVATDGEDLFRIRITDPARFSARVVRPANEAPFDTMLFLFDAEGRGLLANDDAVSTASLSQIFSSANDGSGARVRDRGVYYLAITGAPDVPASENGRIFTFASPTEVSGPDGPGGGMPLIRWIGDGQVGRYTIELSGATYGDATSDTNADGLTTVADLIDYLQLFRIADADTTGDGETTVIDMIVYLQLFHAAPKP